MTLQEGISFARRPVSGANILILITSTVNFIVLTYAIFFDPATITLAIGISLFNTVYTIAVLIFLGKVRR